MRRHVAEPCLTFTLILYLYSHPQTNTERRAREQMDRMQAEHAVEEVDEEEPDDDEGEANDDADEGDMVEL